MALLSFSRFFRGEVSVSGICTQAVEFRAVLASAEPGTSTPGECAEIVEELARTEKACAMARVRYAARAAECGEHRKRGYADASDWLAGSAGSSRGEARSALEELHARQQAARAVTHRKDKLGMIEIHALLPPEVGTPLVNRLDAETDRVRR